MLSRILMIAAVLLVYSLEAMADPGPVYQQEAKLVGTGGIGDSNLVMRDSENHHVVQQVTYCHMRDAGQWDLPERRHGHAGRCSNYPFEDHPGAQDHSYQGVKRRQLESRQKSHQYAQRPETPAR